MTVKVDDGRNRAGHDDATQKVLAAADDVLISMSDGFRIEARRLVRSIRGAVHGWRSDDGEDYDRLLRTDAMFDAGHELRGQAATFGYGLLTELSDSLCTLIELDRSLAGSCDAPEPNAEKVADAIVHHANAIGAIVEHNLSGDGGEWGRKLSDEVARLRIYMSNVSAPATAQ